MFCFLQYVAELNVRMYLLFCFIWEEGYTFLYDFVNVKLVEKKEPIRMERLFFL